MFVEIIIALILGILAGTFTGLIPGIHVNLISLMVLGASGYFLGFIETITVSIFIVSMAITHTFMDSIPGIFLGAPDSDMVLGVLPGHRMLLDGEGYQAVKLTVIGSFFGLILSVSLIPLLIPVVTIAYAFLKGIMAYVLIGVVLFMIWKEQKKLAALFQFLLAGCLGLIVVNFPQLKSPLFPMLSGLFGTATLLVSLNNAVTIPAQDLTRKLWIKKSTAVKAVGASVFSGGSVALLPGLGSAQAGIMGNYLTGDLGDQGFLILIGGINTVNMVVSLLTFYALNKARNGAIVVVKEIMELISFSQLGIFLAVALIVGSIAAILTLFFTKKFSQFITKVNYKWLCISIITFISILVFYFSGIYGFLVLIVSTAVGIIPPIIGVKRSHSMGCLLLPVILWFLL